MSSEKNTEKIELSTHTINGHTFVSASCKKRTGKGNFIDEMLKEGVLSKELKGMLIQHQKKGYSSK